ncbi:uncharacterized protein LOC100878541 [Megachile rotundata]|uniref:uncharacterized protein LOC100878541 n=1 Tax=Megachile rotundata TaxID=143995 RepID=UPI000614EEFB|nr:PREDICTED: uncharacterized protein LOC100878541 isoform X1 [Megachile rotundata]XP_012152778.1 PREDICTED: uncharacterized protein LOC100878541 isoform X1 [Megachile rotundata]XP_012152779.1 PREDICTED: uncharacterized protein LOC100878541 isoform X1 [Megachile rotundata]XP_012152780.1 PREDICTED: uncharacterized protein LOC100878541 isoform X1 [Megachile rotundata]XP_012152781.1 PREDICTED: uncharacterized protein LOC100878541 isoform X1 [Megachile rotundata]
MTNMKASVLICWTFLLQSILIVSARHADINRTNDNRTNGGLQEVRTEESLSRFSNSSSWMIISIRSKRSEEIIEETIPTRHSKHRKRRRCRNRPTCFRGTSTNRFFPRSNSTEHKIKNEDYDVTEIIEEKDAYDEHVLSDEIELEKVEATSNTKSQSKKNEIGENIDYKEDAYPSPFYVEDQVEMPESLGALLSKLFQSLRNASTTKGQDIFKELNFVNATNEDPCQKWLNSKEKLEKVSLGGLISLPACPCEYPSNIFYEDKIWDEKQKKYFRWRDVSGNSQRLDIYKPGATYCIRSLLTQGSGSAAAQHCCYDRSRKLLTRGSGAGTPNFVSPEISPILHERIDILPWRLCKGDFSRYNGVRPPNNDNGCEANPDDEEYQRQIDDTKHY